MNKEIEVLQKLAMMKSIPKMGYTEHQWENKNIVDAKRFQYSSLLVGDILDILGPNGEQWESSQLSWDMINNELIEVMCETYEWGCRNGLFDDDEKSDLWSQSSLSICDCLCTENKAIKK